MKQTRAALAALLLVFVLLTSAYNFVTPAATAEQHNPDEAAHLLYVQAVAAGHLPVFRAGANDYEAHQPPLYYALCAPVYLLARGHGETFAARAVRGISTLLGALLVCAAFGGMRTLFPAEPTIALGTAYFVALLPMNVAQSASVTNDALLNLLCGVAVWQMARLAMRDDNRLRQAVWLGATLGAGLWTKTSALLLFPAVAALCYGLARQGVVPAKDAAQLAFASMGLALLIASPWLTRNQLLYGDPVAQHIFQTAFGNTAQAADVARFVFHGSLGAYLGGVARWTFASFWGVFDSMRLFWGQGACTPSPAGALPLLYDALAALCAVSVMGLPRALKALSSNPAQTVALAAFAVLVGVTGLAHLRFLLVFFQAQGRYWYPALVPVALLFVLGVQGWLLHPNARRAGLILLAAGLLLLNVYTLTLLAARFGGMVGVY